MCCDGFALLLAQAQFEAQFDNKFEQRHCDHEIETMVPVTQASSKVKQAVKPPARTVGALAAGFAAFIVAAGFEWTARPTVVPESVSPREAARMDENPGTCPNCLTNDTKIIEAG